MKIKFNLFILILLISKFSFEQSNTLFENKDKETKAKINLYVSDLTNSNPKTIIYGAVFSPTILNFETYDQNWLNSFHSYKIDAKFNVYPNIDNTGINFSFDKRDSIEMIQSSQSMLIIIVQDSSIIDFINKNKLDLSVIEHCSKSTFTIYKLINISGYKEFQRKTNKLFHYLDNFEINVGEKKQEKSSNSLNFNVTFKNSLLNKSNEYGFSVTKNTRKPVSKSTNFTFGFGIANNNNYYTTTENKLLSKTSTYNLSLDSIYCKFDDVKEEYYNNSVIISGSIGLNRFFKKNYISFELSPFISVYSISNSKVISGNISTYGYLHEINEYLINIPEFNLENNSEKIIGTINNFKTQQYGINVNLSYNIFFEHFRFKPFLNFQVLKIINKNTISDIYSFYDFQFKGGFSDKKSELLLSPFLGISLIF